MELIIDNKTINLKYTFRALLIYERLTGHTFEPTGLNDVVIFFYSCILAADKTFSKSFDEFIDYIDEDPMIIPKFSEWLSEQFEIQNNLKDADADAELKKKKKTTKRQTK